jgi:hypothetical protein
MKATMSFLVISFALFGLPPIFWTVGLVRLP